MVVKESVTIHKGAHMMLSSEAIKKAMEKGEINIKPFNQEQLGPNSYDLRLHNELMVYDCHRLDMKKELPTKRILIGDDGFELQPGTLYLARTHEWTATDCYAPMLEGRSSVGRLGLSVHITAGFGNLGSSGYWTLELSVVQPLTIYPGVKICQVYFLTIEGAKKLYIEQNKYRDADDVQPSMLWKELK